MSKHSINLFSGLHPVCSCIVCARCFMSQRIDDRKRAAYHKRCEHLAINSEQIQSALEERSSHHPAGYTVKLNENQANIINTFRKQAHSHPLSANSKSRTLALAS